MCQYINAFRVVIEKLRNISIIHYVGIMRAQCFNQQNNHVDNCEPEPRILGACSYMELKI